MKSNKITIKINSSRPYRQMALVNRCNETCSCIYSNVHCLVKRGTLIYTITHMGLLYTRTKVAERHGYGPRSINKGDPARPDA